MTINVTGVATPDLVARVVAGREGLYITQYLSIAAVTALLFDYAVTIDDERRLMWVERSWTWPKALFFANRYFAMFILLFDTIALLAPAPSDEFCAFFLAGFLPWTGILQIFIVQGILCVRLYALYGRQRWVQIFLAILYLSTSLATAGALGYEFKRINVLEQISSQPPLAGFPVCFAFVSVQQLWIIGIPAAVFDLVAFGMAAYKALEQLMMRRIVQLQLSDGVHVQGQVRPPISPSRLRRILIRHSIYYFCLISTVYLFNIIVWLRLTTMLSLVGTSWGLALLSIAGNRMILTLRKAREEESANGGEMEMLSAQEAAAFASLAGGWGNNHKSFLPIMRRMI